MENTTALERAEVMEMEGIKGQLVGVADQYCSIKPNTKEQKAMIYRAMNNPDKRLADMINMEIAVTDMYCEVVQLADQNTGEIVNMPRIVLIDENGVSYQCVSKGIFSSVRKLIGLYGEPTWHEPIHLIVKSIKTRNSTTALTLDIA